MSRIQFTKQEIKALLVVIHGAQDDDDEADAEYTKALASSRKKMSRALTSDKRREEVDGHG